MPRSAIAPALVVAVSALVAVPAASATAAPAMCRGHVVTNSGSNDDDTIVGTPDRDVIRTWKGDDVVRGRGGNDIICTDRGADTLIGGNGNDRLYGGPFRIEYLGAEVGSTGDRFVPGHGNDRVFGGGNRSNEASVHPAFVTPDRIEFPAARGGITVTKRGIVTGRGVGRDRLHGIQRVQGTKWGDDITVRGDRIVVGKGGADTLIVRSGKDDRQIYPPMVAGQHGNDRIDVSRAGVGGYELYGGTGRDLITGSKHQEYISDEFGRGFAHALGGYDQIAVTSRMSIRGGARNDILQVKVKRGHRGAINGGKGRDGLSLSSVARSLYLNARENRLQIGKSSSRVRGVEKFHLSAKRADVRFAGSGAREVLTSRVRSGHELRARMGPGNDNVRIGGPYGRAVANGGPGADEMSGAGTRDRFFGDRGNDEMLGDSGNDALRGGPGRDSANGGRGNNDLCRAEAKSRCER